MSVNKKFTKRFAKLRKEYGLTYQQLAEDIGSTKSYMYELEKGISDNPSLSTLHLLSVRYNITISELIGE